mgnify:FL=1
MRVIKKRKKKRTIILKLTLLVFIGYVIFTFINQQIQINQKKAEYEQKIQEVAVQNVKNEEMSSVVNSTEEESQEYIEKIARENLDFAKEGERVFVNISGN